MDRQASNPLRTPRHTSRHLGVLVLAAVVLSPGAPASADEPWDPVRTTSDGIRVSRRPGPTSGFHVLRLEVRSPVAPERLADVLWASFLQSRPPVQARRFLVTAPDEVVFHDRIKVAVVSDRDYTMRIRRSLDGGIRRILFRTATDVGPPPDPDFVRIPIVEGSWEFRPEGEGTAITYTVYSEPGGAVPAFMVRGAQVDEALDNVRDLLQQATRAPGQEPRG